MATIRDIFNEIKNVQPTAEFVARSKATICRAPQIEARVPGRFWERVKLSSALAFASVLVLIGFGSINYLSNNSAPVLGSFNNNNLLTEASSLNFQLQIKEATYFTESAETVALALDEIAKDNQTPSTNNALRP